MNRAGRRFWGLGALEFLSFLCAQANSIAGYLSKSMGVASLNTKAMLSMCFYLCPIFSVVFLFVFFFCYNVIHLRWMTVVAHLRSPTGKSHLIRFLPRCHLFHPLIFYRNQSPLPAVPSVLHSGPQILAPVSGILPDPLPSHSSLFPPFADAPPRPHRPHRPHGPGEKQHGNRNNWVIEIGCDDGRESRARFSTSPGGNC